MNKQLTKKTIGIAASAALMASVAFSGSALAGPGNKGGNKQGPQASASVTAYCNIVDEMLVVDITFEDKSSGIAEAMVATAEVQGEQKDGGRGWDPLGSLATADISTDGDTDTVRIPLCGQLENPLTANAKAVNALVSVSLSTDEFAASKTEYLSRCKDNPLTEDVNEADLKLEPFNLSCQQ
jgi:hypothetical protein